jgi:hypothetical protein
VLTTLIDGTQTVWKPHLQKRSQADEKSAGHLKVRRLLHDIFPTLQILEEVNVQISKTEYGFFDFYLPLIRGVVEVNGQQHYKFNPFFHKDMKDFLWQKQRDKNKRYWCELNDVTLVELNDKDDEIQWKTAILQKLA